MARSKLHERFERLIGTALVDSELRVSLLSNPQAAALGFGLVPADAALLGDIRAGDLQSFARAAMPRFYGEGAYGASHQPAIAG